ncbi:MAG TPA: hypothetical protein VJ484_09730 [Lysobacter sp.]|nr:hypothetical protein [Lysobacter sp.]
MNIKAFVLLLTLPLCATAAPMQGLQDEAAHNRLLTLDQVTASSPARAVVKVDCDNAMWPTVRQVARYTASESQEDAELVRRHIVSEGRRACWKGATHVLVEFNASAGEMAFASPSARVTFDQ